ncbi:hypothetical protein D3C73_1392560 [compost metagenome]
MIYGPDALLFQNGSDNRLQKISAFFAVSRFPHLNNVGNVLQNSVLLRLLLQMCAHNLVIGCVKARRDFILIQY